MCIFRMSVSLMTIVPAAKSPNRCEFLVSKMKSMPMPPHPTSIVLRSHLMKKEPMVGRDPFLLMTLNFMIYFPGVCPLLNVSHQKSYIQINMTSIKNKNMSQRVSSMLPISPSNNK